MIFALLLLAAALQVVAAEPIITDTIGLAADGLNAQIEDDINPGDDSRLVSMKTTGCKTELIGSTRQWTIDWSKTEMVAPGDTFVFVDAPPVKLAIVGDASKPDQAAKLSALYAAMSVIGARCKE
jgi:azurin